MDLFLASLHFPQKLPLNDLSVHQDYPKLVLMGMDMVLEGLGVHRMDKLVCALLSCQIGPSTYITITILTIQPKNVTRLGFINH